MLLARYLSRMSAAGDSDRRGGERARRRAARKVIAAYHDQELRLLLDHVRDGFARMDAGEIEPLGLDELIDHYRRAGEAPPKFCGFERLAVGDSGANAGVAAQKKEATRPTGREAANRRRRTLTHRSSASDSACILFAMNNTLAPR